MSWGGEGGGVVRCIAVEPSNSCSKKLFIHLTLVNPSACFYGRDWWDISLQVTLQDDWYQPDTWTGLGDTQAPARHRDRVGRYSALHMKRNGRYSARHTNRVGRYSGTSPKHGQGGEILRNQSETWTGLGDTQIKPQHMDRFGRHSDTSPTHGLGRYSDITPTYGLGRYSDTSPTPGKSWAILRYSENVPFHSTLLNTAWWGWG